MIIRNSSWRKLLGSSEGNNSLFEDVEMEKIYGSDFCECKSSDKETAFIFSQSRAFDLIELEQLLQSVGWSRRPIRRVKKALDNSLLKVGLWRHDSRFPRLVGFARCTGDGFVDATVWDVAIHPIYQGAGLGKELMSYILKKSEENGCW